MTAAQINRNKVQEKTSDIIMIDNAKRKRRFSTYFITNQARSIERNQKSQG